jgi:hypothetical protein
MLAEYGVLIGSTLGSLTDYMARTYHALESVHLFAAVAGVLLLLVIFKR